MVYFSYNIYILAKKAELNEGWNPDNIKLEINFFLRNEKYKIIFSTLNLNKHYY
ncbi:MAG: hypothetical protein ACOCP8_07560 [archaeon]